MIYDGTIPIFFGTYLIRFGMDLPEEYILLVSQEWWHGVLTSVHIDSWDGLACDIGIWVYHIDC